MPLMQEHAAERSKTQTTGHCKAGTGTSRTARGGRAPTQRQVEPRSARDVVEPRSARDVVEPRSARDVVEPRSARDVVEPRSARDVVEPRSARDVVEPRSARDVVEPRPSNEPPASLADVRGEVTAQLKELKKQLNKEIVEDLSAMKLLLGSEIADIVLERVRGQLYDELIETVTGRVAEALARDGASHSAARGDLALSTPRDVQLALAARGDHARQLAVVDDKIRAASAAMGREVYKQVITEINEKVVPRVDSMMQMVNYRLYDGTEVIDSYRRAVEHQSRADDGMLAITDGRIDKRIISPHVRTFFGGPDEED